MRKLAIALAFVGCLLGFSATSAQAQGVGVYVGPGGIGVSIGSHRGSPYWGYGYRHGGYRHGDHWGGDYRRYPSRDVYGYPDYRGGRYYYDDRFYDRAPRTITVTVIEYRQIRTRYGWEDRPVRVRVTAYWDSYFGAYVYRDTYGRQHVIDGY
ncbi:MAG TPA: hypothetical protein PKZ32_04465 [Candidatus Melainabacteria bacterium]|nr:hypothetical protein [Candidatus Melainabacteria bacterium]